MIAGNFPHLEMNGAGESNPILRRCTMITIKSVICYVSHFQKQIPKEVTAYTQVFYPEHKVFAAALRLRSQNSR